jgi:hypothetical protein
MSLSPRVHTRRRGRRGNLSSSFLPLSTPNAQLGEMDGPGFTDAERGAAAVARANEGQRYDAETVGLVS